MGTSPDVTPRTMGTGALGPTMTARAHQETCGTHTLLSSPGHRQRLLAQSPIREERHPEARSC